MDEEIYKAERSLGKIRDYVEWGWNQEDVHQVIDNLRVDWCINLLIELCHHEQTVKYYLTCTISNRDSRYLEVARKLVSKVRPCTGKDKVLIDIVSQKW